MLISVIRFYFKAYRLPQKYFCELISLRCSYVIHWIMLQLLLYVWNLMYIRALLGTNQSIFSGVWTPMTLLDLFRHRSHSGLRINTINSGTKFWLNGIVFILRRSRISSTNTCTLLWSKAVTISNMSISITTHRLFFIFSLFIFKCILS